MCVSESVIVFFFSLRFSRGSWSDGLGLCRRGETQCADLHVRFEEPRGDVRARGLGTTAVASVGVCSSQKHHPRGFGPFTHTRGVTPVLTQYANEARETSTQHSGRPNAPSLLSERRRQSSLTGFAYGKHSLPSARPLGSVGDRAAGREALSSRVSSCVSVNALVRLDPRGKAAGGEGTPLKARGDFLFVGC